MLKHLSFLGELAKILAQISPSEAGGAMATAGKFLRDLSHSKKITDQAVRYVRAAYDRVLQPLATGPLSIEEIVDILDLAVQAAHSSGREEFLRELKSFMAQRFGASLKHKDTS